MQRFLWLILITTAMIFFGCESQEQPAAKTAPHQVVKPETPIKKEEIKPAPPAIVAAQAAAEQAEKNVEETAKTVENTVEKTVEAAATTAEEIQESVQSKTEASAESTVAAVTTAMSTQVAEVKETAVPSEIVIEASYGNVTLPHRMHADSYECSTCHGDATPAAFELGKETAHKLCKGCHKDEGVGPTGCKGCHVK